MIDYNYLEDDDVNVREYVNDLLNSKIGKIGTIEEADQVLEALMQTIENIQQQAENKKQKVEKELETALAISEINLTKKQQESQQISNELRVLKDEYQTIKSQIK